MRFGGADSLRALSQRAERFVAADPLRQAAEDALEPSVRDMRREVRSTTRRLPESGGLADRVAETHLDGIPYRAGDAVGLRIRARAGVVRDPASIDRGRVRHPTYGHRPWVIQVVRPGWFRDAAKAVGPDVGRRLKVNVRKAFEKF